MSDEETKIAVIFNGISYYSLLKEKINFVSIWSLLKGSIAKHALKGSLWEI